jgi:hypothetical protein
MKKNAQAGGRNLLQFARSGMLASQIATNCSSEFYRWRHRPNRIASADFILVGLAQQRRSQ